MFLCLLLLLGLAFASPVGAQTIDDGVMMRQGSIFAGTVYSHERWDEYWEGTLKRDNGNIGTLTTQSTMLFGNYGLTDRLNIIATAPYVRTRANQGVLQGMEGFQDLTVAAKYNFLARRSALGTTRAIAVVAAGIPLTDYTPDFAPLSIGTGSKRLSGRFTLSLHGDPGWYANGSMAHTWRGDVTLDRPFYYTDGQLFFSDQVDMPNVFDYIVTGGYAKHGVMAVASFSQQRTLGGGDIRRQDMPFVSNRMNFSKVGGMAMVPVPKLRRLSGQVAYAYTIDGRNVGQANTVTFGVMYTLPFHGPVTR
jgi:hypothetical protein